MDSGAPGDSIAKEKKLLRDLHLQYGIKFNTFYPGGDRPSSDPFCRNIQWWIRGGDLFLTCPGCGKINVIKDVTVNQSNVMEDPYSGDAVCADCQSCWYKAWPYLSGITHEQRRELEKPPDPPKPRPPKRR